MKVNKMMVRRRLCSRREANDYIKRGMVLVDGQPATLGQIVGPYQSVELLPAANLEQARKVTIILNKPIGWVSQNSDAQGVQRQRLAIKLLTWQNQQCTPQAGSGTRDTKEGGGVVRTRIVEALEEPFKLKGLAVAGRLDTDSHGLLIFSQVTKNADRKRSKHG